MTTKKDYSKGINKLFINKEYFDYDNQSKYECEDYTVYYKFKKHILYRKKVYFGFTNCNDCEKEFKKKFIYPVCFDCFKASKEMGFDENMDNGFESEPKTIYSF